MKATRTTTILIVLLGLVTTASAQKDKPSLSPDEAKAKQAYALGVQAYLWGYPMVVMQRSRDAMTKGGDAPVTPRSLQQVRPPFCAGEPGCQRLGYARA